MLPRPRRSSNVTDLLGYRNDPLKGHATLISSSNVYSVHSDSVPSSRQLQQTHVRRKKQHKRTSFKGIQSHYFRRDGLGRLFVISASFVLCFWMSQATLLHMMSRKSSNFTTKMRAYNIRRTINRPVTIDATSFYKAPIVYSVVKEDAKQKLVQPSPFRFVDQRPDFGGIDLRIAEDPRFRSQPRTVFHDFHADIGYAELWAERDEEDDEAEDDVESYYAFDDDAKRNPYVEYDDPDVHLRKQCRRTSWHRDVPLNCNAVHEFDFSNSVSVGRTKFVGYVVCIRFYVEGLVSDSHILPLSSAGAYRQVYMTSGSTASTDEDFVLKLFSLHSDFSYDDFEFVRMDANINEKLNGNTRIVSTYSFCGTSATGEAMIQGDLEKVAVPTGVGRPLNIRNDAPQLTVRNTLTGTQKLVLSLEMAEAVLLLHTFPKGVIVHDDIQLSQFLLSSNGQLKLNDFNRAEIMLWNEKDREYCKYRNHPGAGDVSSPDPLDAIMIVALRYRRKSNPIDSVLTTTVARSGRISRPSSR